MSRNDFRKKKIKEVLQAGLKKTPRNPGGTHRVCRKRQSAGGVSVRKWYLSKLVS